MSTARTDRFFTVDQVARAQRRLTNLRRPGSGRITSLPKIWESAPNGIDARHGGNELDLAVRSVRWRDVPGLSRFAIVHRLNQPEIDLRGFSVGGGAVLALMPGIRSKPKLFVASVDDKTVGFAQFQPAFPDRRWHAISLGTATGVFDAGPVEDALIRHAVTAAGLRGVKRLYARIPSGTDLLNSFCRAGFAPYATETVFVSEGAFPLGQSIPARKQEQSDTWAIHQLYNATSPKTVQYAEALTSHRWDLTGGDELARRSRRLGWLVDDGQALAAYGRVCFGDNAHSMEFIYLPDRSDVLSGLIDTILNDLRGRSHGGRLYCTLRGYQGEIAKELESRGFEPILEQDLLVKYTTATARSPQPEPLALHSEVIERLPKRVPSFLQQKPQDEAAR